MTWKFEWITDWDTIWSDSFQRQWMDWMEADPESHVFFHPALAKAWVETYLPLRRMEPRFLVAEHNETTVFMPLVLWRRNWKNAWQRLLVPVGYSDFDYHDPIWGPQQPVRSCETERCFWDALQNCLKAKGSGVDQVLLDGVCYSPSLANTNCAIVSRESCPQISLEAYSSMESYIQSLPSKIRSEIRRRRRRISEAGQVDFRMAGSEDVLSVLAEIPAMLAVHTARWPGAYKAPRFHETLVRNGLRSGVLCFSTVGLDRRPISWRLGFHWRNTYYSYMTAFREEYAKYSPGLLHLLFCIGWSIDNGCAVYDMLRGAEAYKDKWTSENRVIVGLKLDCAKSRAAKARNGFVDIVRPGIKGTLRHARRKHGRFSGSAGAEKP